MDGKANWQNAMEILTNGDCGDCIARDYPDLDFQPPPCVPGRCGCSCHDSQCRICGVERGAEWECPHCGAI